MTERLTTTTANILLSIYYVPGSCAKGVPWITAFIPCDSPAEICMLVFCISQLGGLHGEVNSSAQDYTVRKSWRPGSESCSQPPHWGGLPTSPFCFSSQSYWVYIFNGALKNTYIQTCLFSCISNANFIPTLSLRTCLDLQLREQCL